MIWSISINGNHSYANKFMQDYFGSGFNEVLRQNWIIVIHLHLRMRFFFLRGNSEPDIIEKKEESIEWMDHSYCISGLSDFHEK